MAGGRPSRRRAEVLGPRPAELHRQLGAVEQRLHRSAARPAPRPGHADGGRQCLGAVGAAQLPEDLLLAPGEQLGEHPVDHHRRQVDHGLLPQPARQLQRLVHRHLLRRGHHDHSGRGRVAEDVEHPPGLVAHQAHLHQVVDRLGGGQLAHDVARCRRVHHHQVVVALPHLVAELADGQDLLDARRGVGHEVERAGERPEPGEERKLELQPEVLLERGVGVHGHRPEAGRDLALPELGGGRFEGAGDVALGVDLAQQRASSLRRRQRPERSGDRRLADTALAGHEQQAAVE